MQQAFLIYINQNVIKCLHKFLLSNSSGTSLQLQGMVDFKDLKDRIFSYSLIPKIENWYQEFD